MTMVTREPGEKEVWLGPTRTQELEAPLTEGERTGLERQIADASAEALRLKEEKKAVVAPINERLKEVETRTKELHSQRDKGTMPKPVAVRTRANFFRREKWVVRLDTDEVVPETLTALTDGEMQLMIPGVKVDGGWDDRPDAPVVDLFSVKGAAEETATVTWAKALPAPHHRWKVEKSGTEYKLVDTQAWQVFGPFDWTPATGLTSRLSEATQAALEKAAGGTLQMAALLGATADAVRDASVNGATDDAEEENEDDKAGGTDSEAPEGGLHLYEVDGVAWRLYVHEGYGYLRPPNVDRFTPPSAPEDKGPLEWDANGNRWELGDAAPDSLVEWVRDSAAVMMCADSLVRQGKVPLESLRTEPADDAGPALTPGEEAASPAAEDSDAPMDATEASDLARKLSDSARSVLKLLSKPDAPTDAHTIGSRCHCKAGSVLNGLEAKGLVANYGAAVGGTAVWRITEDGRRVAQALAAAGK